MAISGIASFYLLQRALQAGPLDVVQPGVTIADPIAATVCGAFLFRDSLRPGLAVLGEVLGSLAVVYGVVILSRSPLLEDVAPSPHPVLPERTDLPSSGSTSV
jgi:drug/metabolite transporter (DMT)-like permease